MSKPCELTMSVTDLPEFKKFINDIADITTDVNTPVEVRERLKESFNHIGFDKYNLNLKKFNKE